MSARRWRCWRIFWRDWLALGLGVLGLSGAHQNRESRRVFLLIVIATIPAVIVGFLLERYVRGLFASPSSPRRSWR